MDEVVVIDSAHDCFDPFGPLSPPISHCTNGTLLCFDERLVILGSEFGSTHYATFFNATDTSQTDSRLLVRVLREGGRVRGWKLVRSLPRHPNLLSVSLRENPDSLEQCILMERCGGDMFRFMWELDMNEFLSLGVSVDLISVVTHMHAHGMAHRDIKPENVLISFDGSIKLSDFDFVTDMRYTPLANYAGTPRYSPPKIFKKVMKLTKGSSKASKHPPKGSSKGSRKYYDTFEVDNYALCITIIDVLARDETFGQEDAPIEDAAALELQFEIIRRKFGSVVSAVLRDAFLDLTDASMLALSLELNRKRLVMMAATE
jgi:serine/threonine protein kinase